MGGEFKVLFIGRNQWSPSDLLNCLLAFKEDGSFDFTYSKYGEHAVKIDLDTLSRTFQKDEMGFFRFYIRNEIDQVGRLMEARINHPNDIDMHNIITILSEWYVDFFRINEPERPNGIALNEKKFIGFMKKAYVEIHPFHAYLQSSDDPHNFLSPRFDIKSKWIEQYNFRLNQVNFFGPELADKIGRDKLRVPLCHIFEELPDGGLLIMPVSFTEKGYEEKYVSSKAYQIPLEKEILDWYESIAHYTQRDVLKLAP